MRTYCSLLLLIGILGGFPAGAWAQADPGVKFIPADAALAVVVYPQRLISHDLAQDLDADTQVETLKEQFGVDAKDIGSVLAMVFPPDETGEPDFGLVVQTRRLVSINDILAKEQAEGEYKQVENPRSGVTYLHPKDPEMPVIYPVSGTVWVVATRSLAGRIIAQGTSGQPGELAKVVQRRLTQAEIQIYFLMAPVKSEAEAMLSGFDLPGPFSNIKNLPRDLKQAELTIALSGKDTGVTLILTGNDEDGAIALERLLNTGLAMLEPMLEEFLPANLLAGIPMNGGQGGDQYGGAQPSEPQRSANQPGGNQAGRGRRGAPQRGQNTEPPAGQLDPRIQPPGQNGGQGGPEGGIAALLAELKPKRTRSVVKVTTVGSEVLTPEFFAQLGPALVMGAMMGGAMNGAEGFDGDFGEFEGEFKFEMEADGQPIQPSGQPGQPFGQPSQPMGQPIQPSGQPGQPMGQPVEPRGPSSQPMGQPIQPSGQPSQPMGQPTQPSGQSSQPMGQPMQSFVLPREPMGQPADQPMQSFVLPREPMGQPMGQPVEPRGPSGASSGDDASQARSINNMKQIMLGWHNFHDSHRQMPLVPVRPEHRDADGKPLLSWRVHILPFIEEQPLYEQFKLDEPWDSEHNRPLAAKMPAIFLSPDTDPRIAAEGKTRYLVPVGPGTPGGVGGAVKIADITDGTSNTIAIVEAPQSTAVVWTKPDDLELNLSTISALANSMQGSMIAAFYDGSVRMLDRSMPLPKLQAMLTHAGGEAID